MPGERLQLVKGGPLSSENGGRKLINLKTGRTSGSRAPFKAKSMGDSQAINARIGMRIGIEIRKICRPQPAGHCQGRKTGGLLVQGQKISAGGNGSRHWEKKESERTEVYRTPEEKRGGIHLMRWKGISIKFSRYLHRKSAQRVESIPAGGFLQVQVRGRFVKRRGKNILRAAYDSRAKERCGSKDARAAREVVGKARSRGQKNTHDEPWEGR